MGIHAHATQIIKMSFAVSSFVGTRVVAKTNVRASASSRRASVQVFAERKLWLPNIKTPDYLDGTIAGDYGFDPLGLGSDPERLKYYQEAELMNARWAMMAVAGICTTEALGIQSKWYMAGQEDYGFPINAQLAVLFPTMGFLETKRITGWLATGKSGINETFPFDPLGMGADSDSMKLKEIKNGRAAMIAFVGICVQALVLREGPLAALQDHVANPFGNNLATNVMNLPINLA